MDETIVNGYASHMPILKEIIKQNNVKSVIETGMGDFSTKLFAELGLDFTSIEMSDLGWYQKMGREVGKSGRLLMLEGKDKACEYIRDSQNVDLVLVDGHHYSRFRQVQEGLRVAKMVIAHDSEALVYRWDRVVLPKGFVWVDIEQYWPMPWTAIIARKQIIDRNGWIKNLKHTEYTSMKDKKYIHLNIDEKV